MLILRAYKTEIDPTDAQREELARHAGVARYAFNWGLAKAVEVYKETGRRARMPELQKMFYAEREKHPWASEVSTYCMQSALRDLDAAFDNFFRRLKTGGEKPGFPRFKSRDRTTPSFRLYGVIKVSERAIQIPHFRVLKMKQHGYLPTEGVKINNVTVSSRAGRWFLALQVEQEIPDPAPRVAPVVGVDVGIRSLAVVSDGMVVENPRALKAAARKIRRLQKTVSRRQKGSSNRRKAIRALARAHYRVACLRQEVSHQASTAISQQNGVVVVEDLNVAGMVKNHTLAGAIHDSAFRELRRQLEYKQQWTGGSVVVADRWFPSSKTCSSCGTVKSELNLSERVFRCGSCGFQVDRDLNAAINLRNVAARSTETLNACGRGKVHAQAGGPG